MKTQLISNVTCLNNLPVVDKSVDYILSLVKRLVFKSCTGVGYICIIVSGLSIMWYILNNDSKIAKEGFTGSIVVYIGTKLVKIWLG